MLALIGQLSLMLFSSAVMPYMTILQTQRMETHHWKTSGWYIVIIGPDNGQALIDEKPLCDWSDDDKH